MVCARNYRGCAYEREMLNRCQMKRGQWQISSQSSSCVDGKSPAELGLQVRLRPTSVLRAVAARGCREGLGLSRFRLIGGLVWLGHDCGALGNQYCCDHEGIVYISSWLVDV